MPRKAIADNASDYEFLQIRQNVLRGSFGSDFKNIH